MTTNEEYDPLPRARGISDDHSELWLPSWAFSGRSALIASTHVRPGNIKHTIDVVLTGTS